MNIKYKFCPQCKDDLEVNRNNEEEYLSCTGRNCDFLFYDNPLPVATTLLPIENKIVLIQRNNLPHIGKWCLPGGYINSHEDPKQAAIREVKEETGLEISINRILDTTRPFPSGGNRIIIFYEGILQGGELKAGDDAMDAGLFSYKEMPDICFGSHQKVIDDYLHESR